MSFAGILNGDFVVWHENIAQVDIKPLATIDSFNRLDVVMGVNLTNNAPHIKLYVQASAGGGYSYIATLAPLSSPSLPSNGEFVEVTYSALFSARAAINIRLVITKDGVIPQELTAVKKYILYNNSVALVGGSSFQVNDLGWQTGKVFSTIFKYLSPSQAPSIKFMHVFAAAGDKMAGEFLMIGNVLSTASHGMLIPMACQLTHISLSVSNDTLITDSNGIEILKNGTSLFNLTLPMNTSHALQDTAISLSAADIISVRCTSTNPTLLQNPIVTLYYS